jgi:hypothetical protein
VEGANAEANVAFTLEKTLADVYFGSVLRMIPTFGLQNMNELSVNARHPLGVGLLKKATCLRFLRKLIHRTESYDS